MRSMCTTYTTSPILASSAEQVVDKCGHEHSSKSWRSVGIMTLVNRCCWSVGCHYISLCPICNGDFSSQSSSFFLSMFCGFIRLNIAISHNPLWTLLIFKCIFPTPIRFYIIHKTAANVIGLPAGHTSAWPPYANRINWSAPLIEFA